MFQKRNSKIIQFFSAYELGDVWFWFLAGVCGVTCGHHRGQGLVHRGGYRFKDVLRSQRKIPRGDFHFVVLSANNCVQDSFCKGADQVGTLARSLNNDPQEL